MKKLIFAVGLLALAPAAMATDVGVSLAIGDPNFYGRIDIGNVSRPPVIYAEPVIIERPVRYVERQPIYLRVPPGHAKHWSKHCFKYDACGQRVYFVKDSWYANEYAPRVRERHRDRDYRDRDYHREHNYRVRDDRGNRDGGPGYGGPGHGHGKGHGHGHGRD